VSEVVPVAILVLAIAVILLAVLLGRSRRSGGQTAELETRLAVEQEKSSRAVALEEALRQADAKREALQRQNADLQAEVSRLNEQVAQERKQSVEKLELLKEAKERLTQEFKVWPTAC